MRRIDTEELESYLTREELEDIHFAHSWGMYHYNNTHPNRDSEKYNKYLERLWRQLVKSMVERNYGIKSR